jgi:hypothetical protein
MRNSQGAGGADWSDMTGDNSAEMRPLRVRGDFDDVAAERLLDGGPSGPPSLARLLAAASAPGRRSELSGEESALSAFRLVRDAAPGLAAPRRIVHHERPRKFPRRASVRLLVAGGALAAVAAAGGVAVAAGVVPPGPLRIFAPGPGETSDDHTPGRTAGGPTGSGAPSSNGNGPADPTKSKAFETTPANLNGLCHSFQDAAAEDLPAALASPRFSILVTLAGGASEVPAYCAKIIGDKTQPVQHDGHPTTSPSASVTGQ